MRPIDKLYAWLRKGPTPDCDRIVGAALDWAEPHWADRLIAVLRERAQEASSAVLIGHYRSLRESHRQELQSNPEALRTGIAQALRSSSQRARANALAALKDNLSPCMAYLLPAALRDASAKIRRAAAELLRMIAEQILDDDAVGADSDRSDNDRATFISALIDALRNFDLHKRIEVLEVCLWFAHDLQDNLWSQLRSRRSRAGIVVSEHFYDWNSPRLAGFLLSALHQPGWGSAVNHVLRRWKTPVEITALLRNSRLLEDPELQQQLACVRKPLWFSQSVRELEHLPAELRAHAPHWVRFAAYTNRERVALLAEWTHAADQTLRRSATYVLATSQTAESLAALETAAHGADATSRFARWCIAAQRRVAPCRPIDPVALEQPPEPRPARIAPASPATEPTTPDEPIPTAHVAVQRDFEALWLIYRQSGAKAPAALVDTLRTVIRVCPDGIREQLCSDRPQNRALALQLIAVPDLGWRLRDRMQPLPDEPIKGVARLAQTLMENLAEYPPPEHDDFPSVSSFAIEDAATQRCHQEMGELLKRLSKAKSPGIDEQAAAHLQQLAARVYDAAGAPAEQNLTALEA